jgi:hypothetical protein
VVIPAGTTAKLRVVPYRTPGSPAGKATVTWKTSKATVATPVRGKKSGSLAWTTGNTAALTIKALKPGRATLRLSAAGARTGLVTVKVVAKKNAKPIHAVKITSPSCVLLEGRSMVFTPVVSPAGAVRISGTWRSTNPAVATVDAVGRVTGKAKGTSVIVMKTAGKTAKRTVTVM